MGITKFSQIQADAFLGIDNSPFGKVWYVDGTNGSDGNSGTGPNAGECLASIGQAITNSVAARGDTIIVYPGTYTITSALVPLSFTTIKAAVVNPQAPTVTISGNLSELITVDVSGTRWVGIEFKSTGNTTKYIVDVADGGAVNGATFEDCIFRGANLHEVGVRAFDATNATTGLVIRRCLFRDLGPTQLGIGSKGMPYAKIEDNTFAINSASGVGIRLFDTAAVATGFGFVIRNNDFIGTTSTTDIGIVIAGTKNTVGQGIIRNNYFAYCLAAAVTQDKINSSVINNYYGSNAGGTLVDPTA